jgi:hypothetical protein
MKTVGDELIEIEGGYLLAADREAFENPPAASGVRLLGPGDPLLNARDRERLIPDKAIRTQIWRMTCSPGVVLADGRPAGTWRARKQGRRLTVETEWFGEPIDIREEAERLAALRGAELYDA